PAVLLLLWRTLRSQRKPSFFQNHEETEPGQHKECGASLFQNLENKTHSLKFSYKINGFCVYKTFRFCSRWRRTLLSD
ncbi:hypothetical protein ILYODFUR_036427, partial [Ilyodon furcidens]